LHGGAPTRIVNPVKPAAARTTRTFPSEAIRIVRLGSAGDVTRGALICGAWIVVLGAAARVAVLALQSGAIALLIGLGMIGVLLSVVAFFCALATPILWLDVLLTRRRPGAIEVDEALLVRQRHDETSFPLHAIVGADLAPAEDELSLHTREGDVLRVAVASQEAAERLLAAIASGTVRGTWLASLHRAEALPRWISASWISAALAFVVSLAVSMFLSEPDVALCVGLLAAAAIKGAAFLGRTPELQGSLVVGRDGLALRKKERERFIPFRSVATAEPIPRGVAITLRDGEELRVHLQPRDARMPSRGTSLTHVLGDERQNALLARLRDNLRPAEPEPARAAALLERRGRNVNDWREGLRALLSEAGDYRKPTLSREQAAQVLEDGHAPGELRIGAAMALTLAPEPYEDERAPHGEPVPPLDARTAERLRIAVETCVDQDVRTALHQAVYGELDDATVERALEREMKRGERLR
jgi:hypothetical protein